MVSNKAKFNNFMSCPDKENKLKQTLYIDKTKQMKTKTIVCTILTKENKTNQLSNDETKLEEIKSLAAFAK